MDFTVSADHRKRLKESEKKYKYRDLARELKKTVEHERNNYTYRDWCFLYSHQRIIKGTRRLGNEKTSGDHPNYYIIENGQNTGKRPGYLGDLLLLKLQWMTIC